MTETKPLTIQALQCTPANSPELITQAIRLIEAEYQSNGGNLKDKSPAELSDLINNRGQLWVASQDTQVIATHTVEALTGTLGVWNYLNNGVVAPDYRRRSSGVMDRLLSVAMLAQTVSDRFLVISVVWGIFDRLGFNQVTVDELRQIDAGISEVIAAKIRPGTTIHLGIKQGK